MTIYFDMFAAIVGLLMYLFLENKGSEAGKLAFACGLLALLLAVGMHGVRVP